MNSETVAAQANLIGCRFRQEGEQRSTNKYSAALFEFARIVDSRVRRGLLSATIDTY